MKIICVGLNYREHAREMNRPIPEMPVVFLKPDSAILKNNKPFFIPPFSENIQYEAEVVLKICKVGKYIDKKFAHRYYDELTLGVDMTARDLQSQQSKSGMPWEISKSFDGSAPLGRFIPLKDIGDVNALPFYLLKNGVKVQEGNTSDLIFGFDAIISYISQFFTLKTGDLVFTGTPSGVGSLKGNDRLTGFVADTKVFDFVVK
ncbi:MAG: fumarylacetoacetate hydrolase family protein [Bacteroidales bacterium]